MGRRRRGGAPGRKLLINALEPNEIRIAVLQNGQLDEYYIERASLGSTLGNIYKARITNVEKSIGAAFIDFGHSRQGFLHVSDLCMAAVADDAAELLTEVQAAREVAHDEDVVERAPAPAGPDDPPDESGSHDAAPSEEPAASDAKEAALVAGAEAAEAELPAPAARRSGSRGRIVEGRLVSTPPEDDEETAPAAPEAITEAAASGGPPRAEDTVADAETTEEEAPEEEEADDDEDDDYGYSPDAVRDPWSGEVEHERGEAVRDLADGSDEGEDDEVEELSEASDLDEEDDEDGDGDDGDDEAGASGVATDDGGETDGEDDEEDGEERDGLEASGDGGRGRRRGRGRSRGGRRRRRRSGATEDDAPTEASGGKDADEGDEPGDSEGEGGGRRRRRRRGRGSGAAEDDAGETESSRTNGSGKGRRSRRGERRAGRSRRDLRQMPPIEGILQKGQEIVVQVIKDGIGSKGPTLTTYLSLPGRFIVLMPGIRKRGVSRKVTDTRERERLKDIVRELECPDGLGFIVRTAGRGCGREELQRDLDYLLKLWERMRVRAQEHKAPVLLYQENDLVIRTLRDLYDGQGEIVTDDGATAETAREFLSQILPECVDRVRLYEGEKPLFSHYGIETELSRLLQSRIELKSGATLVIEQTEALVAIDVNSSRYKPDAGQDIDETAFRVNCEAAVEIARQIRLRDLGGVVVIDFIDMRLEKHRKQLERLFKDELRKDRARIKLARFSPFGILEMTRQRVRPSLKRTVHKRCPYCDGTGYVPTDETSGLSVIRKIRENLWRPGSVLMVTVRPEIAETVLNDQKDVLVELERSGQRRIFVRADHRLGYDDIEVRAMLNLPEEMDHRRA